MSFPQFRSHVCSETLPLRCNGEANAWLWFRSIERGLGALFWWALLQNLAEGHLGKRAELELGSGLLPGSVHGPISSPASPMSALAGPGLWLLKGKSHQEASSALPSAGADGSCVLWSQVPPH